MWQSTINCAVLDHITAFTQAKKLYTTWKIPTDIKLVDQSFNTQAE
jgi:hypothetical protein